MDELIVKCESLPAQMDILLNKGAVLNQITTRAADPDISKLGELHTFDDTSLAKMSDSMVEINRVSNVFGRKNSQVTNKLMTLNMVQDSTPYRVMRQCVAEIEDRRGAVKENIFKLRRDKVHLEEKVARLAVMRAESVDTYVVACQVIDIEELISSIEDSMIYLEGALKDVYSFQSAYEQIKVNKEIPDKWDEHDFEDNEIKSHVRFAFLLVYRNMTSTGRMDAGTLEYLHQFGIHPQQAWNEVNSYNQSLTEGAEVSYEAFELWLDAMFVKYGECYKAVMARVGLTEIHDDAAMYTTPVEATEPVK